MMVNARSVLSVIVCFCFLYQQHIYANPINNNNNDLWELHKQQNELKFDAAEDKMRKDIFEENQQYIEKINAENRSYKLGMNHLGHMTMDEIAKGYNVVTLKNKIDTSYHPTIAKSRLGGEKLPSLIDWRKVGAVSPVKDQGKCGSCWAFSTTGAIESHYKLKYGHMKLFSEEQLVNCDKRTTNQGCNGGLPDEALEYAREVGLLTELEYPYTAKNAPCRLDDGTILSKNFTTVRGYSVLGANEEDLTRAIYSVGPTSVAIHVSDKDFFFYKSGVYDSKTCKNDFDHLNHAVLAVGYGRDNSTNKDYYIIKNSWSEKWGEQGYIKMVRNANNRCGVALFGVIPYF